MTVPNSAATGYKNLFTSDYSGSGSGQPSAPNVRSGTVYGPNNELTGTCAVPGASSVLSGVPVDNTTGTATISAADIRAAIGLASANLDTQLAAKPTAAAIRTEMDSNSTKLANLDATVSSRSTYSGADTSGTTTLLGRLTSGRASGLDNLDATVSSRLATSDYTAPPSVGDIAAAVWAAATRTLTTAIDNSATIAAAVWSYATGRTITGGTVDTLTNAPSVPSASAIASQVRTELSTELGRIDVATSTRLAASAYTAPPSAATVASSVRTELATELSRIDAAVSSRLAPDGTLARVTLTDTTTTLTNAPDAPSAEEIAAEVWTNTTRTVTGGTVDSVTNSTPVDAAEIAEAVRTELTPELARVSNAATTQEVADIVEGAAALPET